MPALSFTASSVAASHCFIVNMAEYTDTPVEVSEVTIALCPDKLQVELVMLKHT